MKPYQPSNKVGSSGFVWLLLTSVLGGGAIGGIAHLLSQWIYLIILFPLGMGLGGGAIAGVAVRQGKVRNPRVAALFGALTGVMVYGTMHGADYLQFKRVATEQISQELGQVERNETDQMIDAFLQEETGSSGFWGYLKLSAREGVSIGRIGRDGLNLGETGTWIYWAIEFAIIDFIVVALAYSAALAPFCEPCNQWYSQKKRLATVPTEASDPFLDLLKNDQFREAGKLLESPTQEEPPRLYLEVEQCEGCSFNDVSLVVQSATLDNKGNVNLRQVAQGMITPGQYSQIQEALTIEAEQPPKPKDNPS